MGGKLRLLEISTRGEMYLRQLLVHGARATLRWNKRKSDRRSQWVHALIERRGTNRAVVALANKNGNCSTPLRESLDLYTLRA